MGKFSLCSSGCRLIFSCVSRNTTKPFECVTITDSKFPNAVLIEMNYTTVRSAHPCIG